MKINQYSAYFYPEIKDFLKKDEVEKLAKIIPPNFEEMRQNGETDSYIIDVIRKDLIDDFIVFIHKNNCPLSIEIKSSAFETNSFLIKNRNNSLIEYAAFFGSIQIFQYLLSQEVEMKAPLWIYAIHSRNPEIINFLEEKNITPEGKKSTKNIAYRDYYLEAIKCHHNEIANYVFENVQKNFSNYIQACALENYNFEFIDNNSVKKSSFYDLCSFDYTYLVKLLFASPKIQINVLKKSNDQILKFFVFLNNISN